MVNVIAKVKKIGTIGEVDGNFAYVLGEFQKNGGRLITPREEGYIRVATAGNEEIGVDQGSYVTAGFEYAQNAQPLLRMQSRLLNPSLAQAAVEANGDDKYFNTSTRTEYDEDLNQAELDAKNQNPEMRSVVILPSRKNFYIKPRANFDILRTIMPGYIGRGKKKRQLADAFYEWNGNVPIEVILVDPETVDAQEGTLLTQMWLCWRDDAWSGYGYLNGSYWVHGIFPLNFMGEASAQKNKPVMQNSTISYTQREITKHYQTLTDIQKGKVKLSALEEQVTPIRDFFARLRTK
ncbi:hypothetical protein J4461_00600 [Candidatus Pacearchaeota archaeon]|nr:hypothetical protein [Candidatus Pacearchaeota archaeon]